MSDPNVEIEAARRLLEDPAATASPDADAELRAAMEQMTQTAAALRAWRKGHEAMPAPTIVPVAHVPWWHPGRHTRFLPGSHGDKIRRRAAFIATAAAAALIIVASIVISSTGKWADSRKLSADLAWAGRAAQAAPAGQSVRMEFDAQGEGFGNKLGTGAPAPGSAGSGMPGDSQPPELDSFTRQFALAFRIPQQLPGGWEFERGRPISQTQVQLVYRLRDRWLNMFVSPAGGGDLEFRPVDIGGGKMIAGRRGGLAIAFEGGQADMKIWNGIARELTAKEDSPQRTQRTQR